MVNNDEINVCRICGLLQETPWGEDGKTPSFDICACCGVEFGYEDSSLKAIYAYRQKWLDTGAKWYLLEFLPENWDLDEQLKNIPPQFR
jgi:hypothetical protein